jgi:acyl transferase domain-containing protein
MNKKKARPPTKRELKRERARALLRRLDAEGEPYELREVAQILERRRSEIEGFTEHTVMTIAKNLRAIAEAFEARLAKEPAPPLLDLFK